MSEPPRYRGRAARRDPGNRFTGREIEIDPAELDGDDTRPRTRYLDDTSRSVISRNESPDIPFEVSLNPYRGCEHGCSYCLAGDTPILMADGTHRPLESLSVGDKIYGTVREGHYRRLVQTTVLDHWSSLRDAYRVTLADGTQLVASADHRFLTDRGWKHVMGKGQGTERRPHLTLNNSLLGIGRFWPQPVESQDYMRGYLTGIIRGDGHLAKYEYQRAGRAHGRQYQFRLALADQEALDRTRQFLVEADVQTDHFTFQRAASGRSAMNGIRSHAKSSFQAVSGLVEWPAAIDAAWQKGYLAGLFDAEGSYGDGTLRIHNSDAQIVATACEALGQLDFPWTLEIHPRAGSRSMYAIRITGGLSVHLRFFHSVSPAVTRKQSLVGKALKNGTVLRVEQIDDLGTTLPMFDITTGTGDFVADGVVSHNCYARPSHEYLGLSAGLDFESVIFVKRDAANLLEEKLSQPRWEPKSLMLSGITDPYQPAERHLRVTRACLEVLARTRHPVSLITKNHLVTRDLDLLAELAAHDAVHVTLSITTLDEELRASMEPRTSTAARRLDAVRALAEAGVPVGVNVAPIVPGLTDHEIPALLEAARDAGARSAGYTILRLPGAVEQVFRDWLETRHPARAERILARVREMRGGRLNDPRFGHRMRGSGTYAEQIRNLFDVSARRLGLSRERTKLSAAAFRPPVPANGQPGLFDPD